MNRYFDDTATKRIDEDILAIYLEALKQFNDNPASLHGDGKRSRLRMEEAKGDLANSLDCLPEELTVTSGATEAINTVIKGVALRTAGRGHSFISSEGEHSAGSKSLEFLREHSGRKIVLLPLRDGAVDVDAIERQLERERADLLSFIWVNNENGAVSDIKKIARIRTRVCPTCLFHLDGVQALGKIPFSFKKSSADFISLSLHKVGAPKGIGLLLSKKPLCLPPLLHGGGQQEGRRSGTENPPLLIAAAAAVKKAVARQQAAYEHALALKEFMLARLRELELDFRCLSPLDSVPQIVSLAFPGLRAESFMTALTREGMSVSIGSACSSRQKKGSSVLKAMGLSEEESRHVLRISLSAAHTRDDLVLLTEAMAQTIRQYGRSKK